MPNILPPSGERVINANGMDVTAEVYTPIRKLWEGVDPNDKDSIAKAGEVVTTSTGLVAINLEVPSKGLYPVLTPIRNWLPRRTTGSGAGLGPQWREVTAIAGNSNLPISPWIREGQRAGRMSITTADRSASYATIGLDTDVTFEANSAAAGFEDEYAMSAMRLLQQVMIMEESALVGGNRNVALGTTATPTLSASGSGATLPALTYSVRVFALTYEGYMQATIAAGILRQVTITGADNGTFVVNGGSSAGGTAATQAVTLGQTLFCSIPAITGAVAYAWYVGAAAAERLEAITTINSAAFSAPLLGTGQLLSAVTSPTTDYSRNNGTGGNNAPAFDGLLYANYNSLIAPRQTLATGTAGTGTVLTASGRGTITQIDTLLRTMWDSYRISPDVIWANAQEINNIASKIFGGTANGALRYTMGIGPDGEITAGVSAIKYLNLFSAGPQASIPIKIHPTIPPGTMMAQCQNLPAQYQSANVPMVAQVNCRRDYYQIPWPQVTRRQETGVYAEEVLQVYAPFAIGVITNIANG